MIGYNDDPAATAKTIDAEGWLHTGDLGTMDSRGYLRVTGRVKEMIIRGGENLFPAEIENVLLEHPSIAEVAVVGVPDDKWGEIAICFFRAGGGTAPDRAELVAHLRSQLAAPKTPAHFIAVEGFPLTGSGKVPQIRAARRFRRRKIPRTGCERKRPARLGRPFRTPSRNASALLELHDAPGQQPLVGAVDPVLQTGRHAIDEGVGRTSAPRDGRAVPRAPAHSDCAAGSSDSSISTSSKPRAPSSLR